MDAYKKWIKKVTSGVLLLSAVIIVFNYWVDSFYLFKKLNTNVVRDLQNGYAITTENISVNRIANIYEPVIERNTKEIDVLAIGSSRTMLLHKDLLFGDNKINYMNLTDGTARLTHYARIIGLLNKYNMKYPKNVILGIDPWVFDEEMTIEKADEILNNTSSERSKYLQLFNFEYTRVNIKSLKKGKKYLNFENYVKSKDIKYLQELNKDMIISPDCDMYYPLKKYIGLEELQKLVNNNIEKCNKENYDTKCVKYTKLNNFDVLQYIIKYLKSKGTNVIVFLSPFEPSYFEYMVKYNNFLKYNQMIIDFLNKNSIEFFGSYDPSDFNLTSNYFLDAIHPNEKAIKIIFYDNAIYDKIRF